MRVTRLLVIAAIVAATACSNSSSPPPPPPPPAPPPPPPPPPGPTLGVDVSNNQFNPSTGSVTSGGTVTWSWAAGAVTHNVTFEDGTGNLGDRSTGSGSRTFPTVTVSTTFRYRCTIHSTGFGSGMSGQITVVP